MSALPYCSNCRSYHPGPCHFDPKALCRMCGLPVKELSTGGPNVCPACDCGGPAIRYQIEMGYWKDRALAAESKVASGVPNPSWDGD